MPGQHLPSQDTVRDDSQQLSWEHLKVPGSIARLVRELARNPDGRAEQREQSDDSFLVLFDPAQRLIAVAVLHAGADRFAIARESIRVGLAHQATSVVLGIPRLGRSLLTEDADFVLADVLTQTCDTLGITLLDLVLVGETEYYSFREFGTFPTHAASAKWSEL